MPCANAWCTEVQVVGLFSDKALVVIDGGRPKAMSVGQVIGGVKLVSASSDSAIFEIDGKRRTLSLGTTSITGNYKSSQPSVTLSADHGGHYYADGTINGAPIRFLVDTGATMISIGNSDARRMGINYLAGERAISHTANGPTVVYRVKLNVVKVGAITLNGIDALVHESNDLPFALLGMSFLNRLELKHSAQQLTMTLRF